MISEANKNLWNKKSDDTTNCISSAFCQCGSYASGRLPKHRLRLKIVVCACALINAALVMLLYFEPTHLFSAYINFGKPYNISIFALSSYRLAAVDQHFKDCLSTRDIQYHLIVEGTFFRLNGNSLTGISFVWLNLLRHLASSKRTFSSCPTSSGPQHKVIYIDSSPGGVASRTISSYKTQCDDNTTRPAIIMVVLEKSLEYTMQHKVPLAIAAAGFNDTEYPVQTVYTSTYYTFPDLKAFAPPGLCTMLYVHDTIPEDLKWLNENTEWWPRVTSTPLVNSFVSVSKSTLRDYVRWYGPHVLRRNMTVEAALKLDDAALERETYMSVVLNRISPIEFPGPASREQVADFRKRYSIVSQLSPSSADYEPDYLFSVGSKNWDFMIRGFDRLPDDLIRKFSIVLTRSINLQALGLKHAFAYGPPPSSPSSSPSSGPVNATQPAPAVIRVYQVGYLPRDLVHVAMTGSYALVYVSEYEGFGFPIAEGMASGTLVITSDCSSMPEVGGDVAYYVKNRRQRDVAEMTKTFEHVLSLSKAERQKRVELGLELARQFGGTYGRTDKHDAWEDAAAEIVAHIKSDKHKRTECYYAKSILGNCTGIV